MKRLLFILVLLCSIFSANSQSRGADFLGIWFYLDVDLKNDHREGVYALYEINNQLPNGEQLHVAEGGTLFCIGPGQPQIINYAATYYLCLNLKEIGLELLDNEIGIMDVDVPVPCKVPILGPSGTIWITEGYYTIKLVVKNTEY